MGKTGGELISAIRHIVSDTDNGRCRHAAETIANVRNARECRRTRSAAPKINVFTISFLSRRHVYTRACASVFGRPAFCSVSPFGAKRVSKIFGRFVVFSRAGPERAETRKP